MTIQELIDELETILEDAGNLEVLIAVQPHWPLAHRLEAVVTDLDARGDEDGQDLADPILWLAASEGHPSDRSPYAPRGAWNR